MTINSMGKAFLLPSIFKYIGIFLLLVPVILGLCELELFAYNESLSKRLLQTLACLGFYFLVYSRYKDDDEMLYAIRLKTTAYCVLVGMVLLLVKPLLYYILTGEEVKEESAGGIIMTILFFNALFFFKERNKLKEDLKNEE